MVEFLDEIILGDCLDLLLKVPDCSVRTIHTSPPYNIERGYHGYSDSLSKKDYLTFIEKILSECKRILVPGGSLFWQTGYTSDEEEEYITPLDHLTFSLFRNLGFRLKDRIIWRYWGGMAFKSKFTNKHETILWWIKPDGAKNKPKFNVFPVREATKFYDSRNNLFGRNPGNVWEVDRVAFGSSDQTSHIAVFPEEISDKIILATTDEDELVLDPFSGSGTVCKVAKSRGRHFLGFEISPLYHSESVSRVSLQAHGEILSVLSEIIKEQVLSVGETKRLSTIKDNIVSILSPMSLKPYESIIKKPYLEALCARREDIVKKSDKINLWNDLEELLPPPCTSAKVSRDPIGLISIIDRAYMQAYKLHRGYSSAMRFHCAARWITMLQHVLSTDENEAWKEVLTSLAESETGNYRIEDDKITRVGTARNTRIDSVDSMSQIESRNKSVIPTLF